MEVASANSATPPRTQLFSGGGAIAEKEPQSHRSPALCHVNGYGTRVFTVSVIAVILSQIP